MSAACRVFEPMVLPWPQSVLNPNSRAHYMVVAKAKAQLRKAWATMAMAGGARRIDAKALQIWLVFVPPDRRRRDLDNCLSACKAGLDGLADVLGVDDRNWSLVLSMEPGPGGFVRVSIHLV